MDWNFHCLYTIIEKEIEMDLETFFAENKKCALAFSGGTDSVYLLYAAKSYGCDIKAYYMQSPFQPAFEFEDAKRIVKQLDIDLTVISYNILENEQVRNNSINRCYFCKRTIFEKIIMQAKADGYSVILDGTNASDNVNDRPGMKVLIELHVLSPLKICGITKTDVRRLSKEAGLFTYKKPSYACLATRIPSGHEITEADLLKIEKSEGILSEMGFQNFRIRMYRYEDGVASLETEKSQWKYAYNNMDKIEKSLSQWFDKVILENTYRDTEIIL
ncbi:MAG: ATP-dependent sacrificial sulfur transferase LarE [Lachnospiraceae bacterium]|nr:ATP-dependent sacrificial sulfur transferase LarE [Lachnospiraceae bacterium]